MKKIAKSNLWQIIYTLLGILLVGVFLCVAFAFPKYYCWFHDKNTLNKLNYTDISARPYETAYSSFAEKIHALARAATTGKSLRAVKINNPDVGTSRKELTEIVNAELKTLFSNNILPKTIKVSAKKNSVSQQYAIYDTDKNSSFKGISCWKLEYTSSKRTVTVYLDEEYHKLYYVKIQQKKADKDDVFIGLGQIIYNKSKDAWASNFLEPTTGYQNNFFEWWDGMLQYYGLSLYKNAHSTEPDDVNLTGIIYFKDNCQITVGERYQEGNQIETTYSNTKTVDNNSQINEEDALCYFFDVGIQIEEMLQF